MAKKKTSIYITPEGEEWLKEESTKRGISKNSVLMELINEKIREGGEQNRLQPTGS